MQTLSYGYKKPQTDDTGNVFFPAMELNIQMLNDHTHDGVTSARLATTSQAISHTDWAAEAGFTDLYAQTVTLPAGFLYANILIQLKDSAGNLVNNRIDAAASGTYKVFTNDSAQDLIAEYGA